MALTSPDQLRQWLLASLGDLGGAAQRRDVLLRIEADFADLFADGDWDPPPSRPFDAKWKNGVSWERQHMVDEGLLASPSGRSDPWTLTETGWAAYRTLVGDAEADPLANFKPKSNTDYLAHLEGRALVKHRTHEALIGDFGLWVSARGFVPRTTVHPRDLVLRRGSKEWLVEAKVVYRGNATHAVREAIGQLLTYSYFLYDAGKPGLVALFNEPVGDAYVGFLDSIGVLAVWRGDSDWHGSAEARSDGLI